MRRRHLVWLALLVGVIVLSGGAERSQAQGSNAFAFCYMDTGQFLGAVQPTATGWQWALACAFNDSASGHRDFSGSILTNTLPSDNLAQIGQKLANAVKAEGALHGFTVTMVLLPQTALIAPQ